MLEVTEASKTFNPGTPNEVRPLNAVSLTVSEGEFLIVLGTNGSGKTTLLNAVAGTFLLDSGTVTLAGQDITRWPEHRRAALIGRVFQNPFAGTAPTMSVAENFALAAGRGRRRGLGWALQRDLLHQVRQAVSALNMGLEDRLHSAIGRLSGGQRQALTLLMATWQRPELLLLDEHTAALDPKSADQIIKVTEEIIRRHKLTTLMVTHSMAQAVHLGDRLIMMHRGVVVHDVRGAEKQRLRVPDLLGMFDEIRRTELLDETAANVLREMYI